MTALEAAGFAVVAVPLIARVPHPDAVRAAAGDAAWDVLLLTSAATVPLVAGVPARRVAAVGPKTARAAADAGLHVDVQPARADGESLVAELGSLHGQRVFYPAAREATPATRHALEAAGADVHFVAAYTNVQPPGVVETLDAHLPVDVAPLLSSSAARRLSAALRALGRPATDAPVVAIGRSTERTARSLGLDVRACAATATLDALVAACGAPG